MLDCTHQFECGAQLLQQAWLPCIGADNGATAKAAACLGHHAAYAGLGAHSSRQKWKAMTQHLINTTPGLIMAVLVRKS